MLQRSGDAFFKVSSMKFAVTLCLHILGIILFLQSIVFLILNRLIVSLHAHSYECTPFSHKCKYVVCMSTDRGMESVRERVKEKQTKLLKVK